MKFRKLTTALTTATLVGMLSSSFAFAATYQDNAKQSLVALGDSITYGYNLDNNHHPSKEAFPYLVAETENYRIRDFGVPGSTTNDLLNSLKTSPKFQEAVNHADYITLDIGNNDLLQAAKPFLDDPSHNLSLLDQNKLLIAIQQIGVNLPQIVQEIRKETSAPIIIYNLYNPFPNDPTVSNDLHDLVDRIVLSANSIIQGIAANPSDNIVLADAYRAIDGNQLQYIRVLQGDVHPTELGQEVLAEIGIEAINQTK